MINPSGMGMTGAGPVSNSPYITQPNKSSSSISNPFNAIGSIAGGIIGAGTGINCTYQAPTNPTKKRTRTRTP